MKFEIVELEDISGPKTVVYSVLVNDDQETLFERFVRENHGQYKIEVDDILNRLAQISSKYGAREHFFKLNEGVPGDGVCALYDNPDSNLRLYCIRYGTTIVILGGGGYKPKTIRAFQEDEKLTQENSILREISKRITGELWSNGDYLEGEFIFEDDQYWLDRIL